MELLRRTLNDKIFHFSYSLAQNSKNSSDFEIA